SEMFSLNGEMTFDATERHDTGSGFDFSETLVDLTFSPLVHIASGRGDFVFGPKVGMFSSDGTADYGGLTVKAQSDGTVFGLNAGAFFALGDAGSLGFLFNFELKKADHGCTSALGGTCDPAFGSDALKIFGIARAALF